MAPINKEMAITAAFIFAFAFAFAVFPHGALAYKGNTGDFGGKFYDFAVNHVLHGPLGNVGALGLCLGGFTTGVSSRLGGWSTGIPMMILGGGLYNIDTLSKAVGWIC